MTVRHSDAFAELIATLKVTVATLRDADIPFMLGGSLGVWARGGPEPEKDLDLMVKPTDAHAALQALADAGMRVEHPPEEWLYKAWHGEVLIDVIFGPSGLEITDEVLERADVIPVMSVGTAVMALEDMLVTMLCALDEHSLNYCNLVAIARAVREQIDWRALRTRTCRSPYAKAFFTLVEELGIAPSASHEGASAPAPARVRVVN